MKKNSNCVACNEDIVYDTGSQYGKFCSNKCQQDYRYREVTTQKILNGTAKDVRSIKRYIIEIRGNKCNECGLENIWNNKELTLQLDHIDGDRKNNLVSNLRLLCPNCHSQTITYAGKKNNIGTIMRISDDDLTAALNSHKTIHQALLCVGLAITKANYTRCYKLLETSRSSPSPVKALL